ncbi:glycosyltransferase family 4 protein [Pseudoduganella sp. GCM10020061]|uniref:glycosyltransferase family 4 protein n=1 Tax=Pseudoduganella sp. GCM10020061 TaxID=3317345 RepID=UPI003626F4AD
MRILHIFDHSLPRRTGYALRSHAVIAEQRARGWQTVQLTGPAHGSAGADPDGWQFFRTRPAAPPLARAPLLSHWLAARALSSRIRQVVRLTRPQILHAHAPPLNGIAALRVGRRCRLPVIYEARDWWTDPERDAGIVARMASAAETWVARHADGVAASSHAMLGELRARGARGPGALIPPAIDPYSTGCAPSNAVQLRSQLDLGPGPVIAYVGELREHEGVALLLDALPRILLASPSARLLVAGDGPALGALRSQADMRGITRHTIFATDAAPGQMHHYYPLADVLVFPRLPSRHAALCVPFLPLEAMAHGSAVAASDTGGHAELIENGRTGLLFEPGSAEALAATVIGLLSDPLQQARIRTQARRFVVERRTWEASVARYAPLYQRMLR